MILSEYIKDITKELTLVFWISVYLVSPIFSGLEIIVQESITKLIFYVTHKFQLTRKSVQKIGFNSTQKLKQLQKLHSEYEVRKSITEKLKISEDFLDETRGGMFLLNEMSEQVIGKIEINTSQNELIEDNFYFNRDIISKQDFTIKELKEIHEGTRLEIINNKEYYINDSIRKTVKRRPVGFKDELFKEQFKLNFKQVESDFLENVEMYLFQKRVFRKWQIFKVVAFIPFMLFLSELIEVIFGILFEQIIE